LQLEATITKFCPVIALHIRHPSTKYRLAAVHQAYDFALSFDNKLVIDILARLGVTEGKVVVDPFCGTGTTLVECKRRGIRSIGIDANPVCVLIAKAKLDWDIPIAGTTNELTEVVISYARRFSAYAKKYNSARKRKKKYPPSQHIPFVRSTSGKYLIESGMLKRGWLSPRVALKTVLLVEAINERVQDSKIRRFFLLSLLGLVVPSISNMRYGPEIYRATRRRDVDVIKLFRERVIENLDAVRALRTSIKVQPSAKVVLGDSVNGAIEKLGKNSVDFVITSPPYPSEHDYTRLTRLELVLTSFVKDKHDLRAIKKRLLRCCTRNIYAEDNNEQYVKRFPSVQKLIKEIDAKAKKRSHGFARLYGRVTGEYFGGMLLHLKKVSRVLRPGALCAYVVGDQASFFSVQIKTADILARIASSEQCGLKKVGLVRLGSLRGTTGRRRENFEWLLILEKES